MPLIRGERTSRVLTRPQKGRSDRQSSEQEEAESFTLVFMKDTNTGLRSREEHVSEAVITIAIPGGT